MYYLLSVQYTSFFHSFLKGRSLTSDDIFHIVPFHCYLHYSQHSSIWETSRDEGEGKLKLKRWSNRGVQVAGVKVSEHNIQGNTEQIHQLYRTAGHNLCFYPFTWAVATGHTDNTVYMRLSTKTCSRVDPSVPSCSEEWRGKNAWESKLEDEGQVLIY